MKVKKAIIPAGGLGTRMLPITKSVPKELLPINMKPMIQYALEEGVKAGIKEILIIIRKDKDLIKNYLTGKVDKKLLNRKEIKYLEKLTKECKIDFAYQKYAKGLMDAISLGEDFVNNEPFAVLLPDNIMVSRIPCIKQLIDLFSEKDKYSYIVLKKFVGGIEPGEVDIGGVEYELISKNIYKITHIKNKKNRKVKLKNGEIGIKNFGRYVFKEDVFDYIKKFRTEYRGEFDDTPILNELASEGRFRGKLYNRLIFDTGNTAGYKKASLYFMNK